MTMGYVWNHLLVIYFGIIYLWNREMGKDVNVEYNVPWSNVNRNSKLGWHNPFLGSTLKIGTYIIKFFSKHN